jgi:hypothetical protein
MSPEEPHPAGRYSAVKSLLEKFAVKMNKVTIGQTLPD